MRIALSSCLTTLLAVSVSVSSASASPGLIDDTSAGYSLYHVADSSQSSISERSLLNDDESFAVSRSPKRGWGDFEIKEQTVEKPTLFRKILLYIPNRLVDLVDIFRVDVGVGPSFGVIARASKYVQVGYRSVAPASLRIGDLGRDWPVMLESSSEFGVSPFFVQSKDRDICKGEVGAGADLFIAGIYAGICVDEIFDFIGGIFTFDFKDDDFE